MPYNITISREKQQRKEEERKNLLFYHQTTELDFCFLFLQLQFICHFLHEYHTHPDMDSKIESEMHINYSIFINVGYITFVSFEWRKKKKSLGFEKEETI